MASLTAYLADHPDSPWRASLLANLGTVYRQIGAFGRAMDTWDEGWRLTKDSADPLARAVADYSISYWLEVAASFGQTDVVQKTLEDLEGRNVRGSAATRVSLARETASLIRRYPDRVIASGPEALRVILEGQQGTLESLPPALATYQPTAAGTSLAEVGELARTVGLPLHAARWNGTGTIPVPRGLRLSPSIHFAKFLRVCYSLDPLDVRHTTGTENLLLVVSVSTSPLRYERRYPDGSVEVYGVPDGAAAGQKRVFISETINPQGQSIDFTWDAQFCLVAITDAVGQVTELSYADAAHRCA